MDLVFDELEGRKGDGTEFGGPIEGENAVEFLLVEGETYSVASEGEKLYDDLVV